MADELDPSVLRAFAQAESPLAAEPFVGQITARLANERGLHLGGAGLAGMIAAVLRTMASAILLPLRMRQTRLMTLGAAAVTIWVAFL